MTSSRRAEVDVLLETGGESAELEHELAEVVNNNLLDVGAHVQLARCRLRIGKWAQAVATYQLLVALTQDANLRIELGLVLAAGGAYLGALACQEQVLREHPDNLEARFARAQTNQQLCNIEAAIDDYDKVLAASPGFAAAHSFRLVALNYRYPHTLLREHQRYGGLVGQPIRTLKRRSRDGLRVGILSPDLHGHSCAYFLEPLLQWIPPGQVSVILYYDNIHIDKITERLRSYPVTWVSVVGFTNDHLERRMLADNLDVAVDLAGHFSRQRLPIFAHRVAPTQVSYLGYPNTTGVPAMDYRLADPVVDGGYDKNFTEKLAFLPGGLWAYRPPAARRIRRPVRPTLGYFGLLSKITAEMLGVWASILAQSEVKLIIKGTAFEYPHVRDLWKSKFDAAGIPSDRLELRGRTATVSEHLKMYGDITVALDSWPYNGTATTCEALWCGVPVVTLIGNNHAARTSYGLLAGAKLDRFAARSKAEYIESALAGLSSQYRIPSMELSQANWLNHRQVAEEFWSKLWTLSNE